MNDFLQGAIIMSETTQNQFYAEVNGQQTGPFGTTELAEKIAAGLVSAKTLVWKDGMEGWKAAGEVNELAVLFAPAGTAKKETPPAQNEAQAETKKPGIVRRILGFIVGMTIIWVVLWICAPDLVNDIIKALSF